MSRKSEKKKNCIANAYHNMAQFQSQTLHLRHNPYAIRNKTKPYFCINIPITMCKQYMRILEKVSAIDTQTNDVDKKLITVTHC